MQEFVSIGLIKNKNNCMEVGFEKQNKQQHNYMDRITASVMTYKW